MLGKYWTAALAAIALMFSVVAPAAAEDFDEPPSDVIEDIAKDRYVVVMDDVPLVTEFGQDQVDSSAAQRRGEEMKADHAEAMQSVGVSANEATYNYTVSLNGFAVELNESELAFMKNVDGVMMVVKDEFRQLETDSSLDFIGVAGRRSAHSSGVKGEGVIVGVIDSGIWPEHPSFADDGSFPDPGVELDETVYPACDFGNTAHNPDDAPFECNNKLIGARQVIPTYRALIGAEDFEFDSARDDDGHGTHTASTAAGNEDIDTQILGRDYPAITGVAPRAHVIAYKGLGTLGGFTSDLAAAIDQAVADGVDVINYSIGGGAGGVGADEIAFLFAADAGVRVATSAGNSGPGPATLGDPGTKPWLTTVGANTQKRFFQGTIRLGNKARYQGASVTGELSERRLVDAEAAGGDLCVPGTLDPVVVHNAIVLCRRGAIARAAKSLAVEQAGGAGMILYENTDDNNLLTDTHWVPSVHIDNTPGLEIKEYIATTREPRARIVNTGKETRWKNAPTMAFFSSRGPNPVASDIIKPDITAPGVHILAGYSPFTTPGSTPPGELFAAIQGTSMSSPHVAGVFALLAEAHPDWSAAATRSAIMTTADPRVRDNDRLSQASVFAMGAGQVDPGFPRSRRSAFNPGLVYDTTFNDYLGFMCDAFPEVFVDPVATCAALDGAGVPTEAYNLNYPSIGVAELAGSQVVTRTVTNVSDRKGTTTFRATVDAPAGYEVEVTPRKLKLMAGESATYQVRITNVNAAVGEWREGSLTWRGGGHQVRSPIAVKGVAYAAPGEVSGSGETGSASFPIKFGYTGDYTAAAHGLEPAGVFSDTVVQDPDQNFDPTDGFSNAHQVTTSGSALLRIAMGGGDVDDPAADIDIYVNDSAGNTIATSTAGGTDELIDLVLPDDDTYTIYVHGWSAPDGDVVYSLYTWVISATPGGNMTVDAPASATNGQTEDINVSWTGATAGEWHLGAVSHADGSGLLGLTLIDVDNR